MLPFPPTFCGGWEIVEVRALLGGESVTTLCTTFFQVLELLGVALQLQRVGRRRLK